MSENFEDPLNIRKTRLEINKPKMKSSWLPWMLTLGSVLSVLEAFPNNPSGLGTISGGGGYLDHHWSHGGVLGAGRSAPPTCVDIPRNLSLCHGIGYSKMRLPNLLEHDSLGEVLQQAASWVPLLNVRCHPDTQLFLCSLFSPVCLDRPIYPCRDLCEKVRTGCEGRMKTYGYPWPDMFRCDKFPLDNDMCITPMAGAATSTGSGSSSSSSPSSTNSQGSKVWAGPGECGACHQVDTYENILDHYCRADFVIRGKGRKAKKTKIMVKKVKILKVGGPLKEAWRRPSQRAGAAGGGRTALSLELPGESCCDAMLRPPAGDKLLIMGTQRGSELIPTFILPWNKRSKTIRSAVKAFKKFNCSDPKSVFGDGHLSQAHLGTPTNNDTGRRKRGGRNKLHPNNSTIIEPAETPSTIQGPRNKHKSKVTPLSTTPAPTSTASSPPERRNGNKKSRPRSTPPPVPDS